MPGIESFPILIVHSGEPHNPAIGTGFVVHREPDHDLVLTCAHVVRDVGGPDAVRVDTVPATLVVIDDPGRLDLAVLRVAGHSPAEPLRLAAWAGLHGRYRILGFYQASGDDDSATAAVADVQLVSAQGRRLQGDRVLTPLWGFSTRGDVAPAGGASAFNRVYGGFSGGPVLEPASGRAVAVVMEILPEEGHSGGGTGRVVDIRCLRSLWPELPASLREDLEEPPAPEPGPASSADGIGDAIRQVHETLKTINALKMLHEILHRHRQPLKQLEHWIARQGEGDGPDFPEEARTALEMLKLELEGLRRDERVASLDGGTLEHGWHRRLHGDIETFLEWLGEPERPGPLRTVTRAGREVIRTVDANFPRLNRDLITQIGTLDLQPLIDRIESAGPGSAPYLASIARTLREIAGERGRLLRLGKVHDDWQGLDERITNLIRTLGGLVLNPAGDRAGEALLAFLASLSGHLDTFERTLEHLCSPDALNITENGMYRFLIEKAATNAIKQVRQLRLVAGELGEPPVGSGDDWQDDQRQALASCNRYLDGLFHQVNNGFQKVDTELMEESNRLVLHSPLRDLLELRP